MKDQHVRSFSYFKLLRSYHRPFTSEKFEIDMLVIALIERNKGEVNNITVSYFTICRLLQLVFVKYSYTLINLPSLQRPESNWCWQFEIGQLN